MTKFAGLDLKQPKETFTPRLETELLVEICLKTMEGPSPYILDIGTGIGNIPIALTLKNHVCKIVALDKSEAALIAAHENASYHGVEDRIEFIKSDLFGVLNENVSSPFDIIVSNPPYIATWELATLSQSVREEPRMALDGGEDGLYFYKEIIKEAPRFLKEGGSLIVEIGYNQSYPVKRLLEESSAFKGIELFKDLFGIDRVIRARWIN